MQKTQKITLLTILLAMFLIQSHNAFMPYYHMDFCRHIKLCYRQCNLFYDFLAPRLPWYFRKAFAIKLSNFMRAKLVGTYLSSSFGQQGIIFLPAMKKYHPYARYTVYRQLEGQQRILESTGYSSMKELTTLTEEEEDPHTQRIARATDMASAKAIACEGVKVDSDYFKGAHTLIKIFYQTHLKRVHYLETKENRPIEYFNLECFVDPHNESPTDYSTLSAKESAEAQHRDFNYFNEVMKIFSITRIDLPKELINSEEMSNSGSVVDGSAVTTIPLEKGHNIDVKEEMQILETLG